MIKRVTQILVQRIAGFMKSILADDTVCHDRDDEHQDVRETSMIFKEPHYKKETWDVEIPTNGYVLMMPIFFTFKTTVHEQPMQLLTQPPDAYDVEKFI